MFVLGIEIIEKRYISAKVISMSAIRRKKRGYRKNLWLQSSTLSISAILVGIESNVNCILNKEKGNEEEYPQYVSDSCCLRKQRKQMHGRKSPQCV